VKKQKGVVMGLEGRNVVVYTNEGDFIRLPVPGKAPEIGDVIEVGGKVKKPLTAYLAVAAALVLVAAISLFNPFFGSGAAAAYVALDINPSAELTVNRDGTVIKAKPLNGEAKALLTQAGVNGQDLNGAVESFIKEAVKLGYINKESQNLVLASIVSLKDGVTVVQEDQLRRVIIEQLTGLQVNGTVVISQGAREVRVQAEKAGLSINKYMVYDRSQKQGLDIPVETLRSGNVREVLAQANIPLKKLFPSECVEVRQENQQPADGAGPAHEGMGMNPVSTEGQHGDSMGHGKGEQGSSNGHGGPVRSNGGYGPSPVAPDSSGMMPGHAGQDPANQPDGGRENQAGQMQRTPQDMGGHLSTPAGGQGGVGTADSQVGPAGEMEMLQSEGAGQVSGPSGHSGTTASVIPETGGMASESGAAGGGSSYSSQAGKSMR